MARPCPEKKSEPAVTKILPMELQVGDRIADETSDWEVIAAPYSTAGGRMVHARVQRIDEPASWEIRSWDASKRISVKRTTARGQAMMRLARKTALLVALFLLTSAAAAYAECAWVLWTHWGGGLVRPR